VIFVGCNTLDTYGEGKRDSLKMPTINKSKKVENFFLSQIRQGIWSPGMKLPDAEQISLDLGVGPTTVKSVMTQLANNGLLQRIQKRGTFVSQTVKTANITILAKAYMVQTAISSHYLRLTGRLIQSIKSCGYQPIFRLGYGDTPEVFLSSIQYPQGLTSKETMGILSLAGTEEAFLKLDVPYVSQVSAHFKGAEHGVILDYTALFALAAKTMSEHGYDDFVLMNFEPSPAERNLPMFVELYREQLRAVNNQKDRLLLCPFSPDLRYAYNAFKQYWLAGNRPRAIFFGDDVVFDVASRAILELGIKVPEELAILTEGCAGVHYHFPIPVSCVEFDADEVAVVMWDCLQNQIMGQKMNGPVFIKPRLREGQTL
jgi:DNA-binding LacI/PurR family transcriptional regulator